MCYSIEIHKIETLIYFLINQTTQIDCADFFLLCTEKCNFRVCRYQNTR